MTLQSGGLSEDSKRALRITGIAVAAVAVVGTVAALLVRDQIGRAQRDLFHSLALKRMAALENLSRQEFSVDLVNVLRDYMAWEPRPMLRNRARAILERMEASAPAERVPASGPSA